MENVDFELVPTKEPQVDFDLVPTKDSTTIQSVTKPSKPSTWDIIKQGFGESATGLVSRALSGEEGYTQPQYKPEGFGQELLGAGATLVGDIPAFAASALPAALAIPATWGGSATAIPATSMAGTEAFKAYMRGESPTDIAKRGGVGGAIGGVMGALGPIAKLPGVNKFLQKTAFPLQVGGGEAVGAGLEGRDVTPEGLAITGLTLGGLHAGTSGAKLVKKAIEAGPKAEQLATRQAAAEKAGIPATATTGGAVQPTIKPDILSTTTAASTVAKRRRKLVDDIQKKQEDLTKFQDMIKKKQEETTKVIIDDEVPVEAKLDLDQKKTIEDNVSALGDAEKVRELYKGDDSVSIYARELAAKRFNKGGIENGQVQTETEVKSETPSVQKLNKGKLSEEEFKALEDTNVFAPEELEGIKKLPGFKQREQYNRMFPEEVEAKPYTSEELTKAQDLASKVEAAAKARYSTLGKSPKPNPNKEQVKSFDEVEQELAALRKDMEGLTPDKITPEMEARMVSLMEKVGNELPFDEVVEPTERFRKAMELDSEEPSIELENYVNRRKLIREKLDLASEQGKVKRRSIYSKSKIRLEDALKEVEDEHIPNEDLSPITDIGTKPTRTRAQEINKERESRSGSAEDWEAKLEAEGMPAELNFEYAKKSVPNFTWFKSKNKELFEASEKAKVDSEVKIDSILNNRRTVYSNSEARNLLVKAGKHMPTDKASAEAWFDKMNKLDQKVEPLIANKRSAFTRKAIAKALAKGDISKQEADFMNTIFSTLKKQPTARIEIDKALPDEVAGLYNLANDLIQIKDPKFTSHEVAHWAYYNILTSADRATYRKHFLDTYYDGPGGKVNFSKLRKSTTDPWNTVMNPSEAFAAKLSDYMMDKVITPAEKSLFTKVADWFSGLKTSLLKRTNMDFSGVEDIFKKVAEGEARFDWKDTDVEPRRAGETLDEYNARTVWHGTKKVFKEFKDVFIGSGEGAQIRGYGHYFTSRRDLGEYYAKQVGGKRNVSSNTRAIQEAIGVGNNIHNFDRFSILSDLVNDLSKGGDYDSAIAWAKDHAKEVRKNGKLGEDDYNSIVSRIDNFTEDKFNSTISKKVLHQVEIPDDLNLLDLDKNVPIDQMKQIVDGLYAAKDRVEKYNAVHPEIVVYKDLPHDIQISINALVETMHDIDKPTPTYKAYTGDDLQSQMQAIFGNKGASKFFKEDAGIHGNTFIGESSGIQNFVIFDEKVPQIKSSVTLDMLGFQQMYERITELGKTFKKAKMDDKGRRILGEIKGNDWGLAEEVNNQTIFGLDNAPISERLHRSLGPYIISPVPFVKGTRNERHVYNANLAEMYIGHKFDQHRTTIDSIKLALKKGIGDPNNVRKVIEGKIEGTPDEIQAATEVRQWLDGMKERYKVYMLNEYKDNLSKREYNVLLDIISGSDIKDVKVRHPKLDTETIESIANKYKEIDTWGIDNYIPNVEAGRFKIITDGITEDGKTYKKLVAVGLSEKDAIRKATKYAEENPDVKELFIDTDYKIISDDKTKVTRGQYFGMMNSLAKKMTESIDGIDKGVAKNLASATMKRKFKIIPTDSYSPFLEPRRDILKGEEDIFPVLKSYAHSIEKKMALDPVIDSIRDDIPKMNKYEKEYILDYIEDVKGKYSKADKVVDDIFNTYRGYSRLVSRARTLEANLKLGYRPIAAGINLASGQMHSWVKRGLPIYTEGVKFLNTPEGRKFVEDIEPFLGTSIIDTGIDITSKTPVWKPLGLFQKPEPLNREVSAAAAYVQGLKEGMTPEAAQIFAIRANWAEQFTYNIANLPKIMRGPTGKLLTQFKPYLVKELEFMSSLSGKEWARYLGMQLALGGPKAYMTVVKSLPILAAFGFWEEAVDTAEEWMNKNIPLASRGVGGLPGLVDPKYAFDMSAAASFQFPAGPMDFAGPAISDLVNIKNNVLEPLFTYGPYAEDMKKTGDIAPIIRHWARLMKFTFTDDNWIKDTKGNKLYEVKDIVPFYLQSIAGVESVDISRIRAEERILAQRDVRTRGLVTRIINEAMKHVMDGTTMPPDLVQRMGKYNITGDTLKRRIKSSNLPPDLRIMLNTEVIRRPEVIEQFPNSQDYELSE